MSRAAEEPRRPDRGGLAALLGIALLLLVMSASALIVDDDVGGPTGGVDDRPAVAGPGAGVVGLDDPGEHRNLKQAGKGLLSGVCATKY